MHECLILNVTVCAYIYDCMGECVSAHLGVSAPPISFLHLSCSLFIFVLAHQQCKGHTLQLRLTLQSVK